MCSIFMDSVDHENLLPQKIYEFILRISVFLWLGIIAMYVCSYNTS